MAGEFTCVHDEICGAVRQIFVTQRLAVVPRSQLLGAESMPAARFNQINTAKDQPFWSSGQAFYHASLRAHTARWSGSSMNSTTSWDFRCRRSGASTPSFAGRAKAFGLDPSAPHDRTTSFRASHCFFFFSNITWPTMRARKIRECARFDAKPVRVFVLATRPIPWTPC